MSDIEGRAHVLRAHGASGEVLHEVLRYNTNHFDQAAVLRTRSYPLPDEEFISSWIDYATNAERGKVFDYLASRLPQLSFPIRQNMSRSEDYIAATRRGETVARAPTATGLILEQPGDLSILVYQTDAGKIPIIYTPSRADFVSLLRALTMRNEPLPVPESMGGCIVSGYNNWDRIRAYRAKMEHDQGRECLNSEWNAEFRLLIQRKQLYQDRFLLLSGGDYSGISPAALNLSDVEWREKSLVIRREHECTHYLTRRVFSSMRNHLLDELIADYSGMVAATGCFRADWFLRFMGLEDFPAYRCGGRLENYCGEPALSGSAFRVLQAIVKSAAESLERFTDRHSDLVSRPDVRPLMLTALSTLTLEELAGAQVQKTLTETLQRLLDRSQTAIS